MPHQRSIFLAPACFSDHRFLLWKGVPEQWLSFDVGTESIVDPIDKREGVGRGYDVDFPAVFKAKVRKPVDDAIHLGTYLYGARATIEVQYLFSATIFLNDGAPKLSTTNTQYPWNSIAFVSYHIVHSAPRDDRETGNRQPKTHEQSGAPSPPLGHALPSYTFCT